MAKNNNIKTPIVFTSVLLQVQSYCAKKVATAEREKTEMYVSHSEVWGQKNKHILMSLLPKLGLACWWHLLRVLQGKIDVNEVIV